MARILTTDVERLKTDLEVVQMQMQALYERRRLADEKRRMSLMVIAGFLWGMVFAYLSVVLMIWGAG